MSTSPIDDIENRIIEDDDNDFRKVTLTEKHIPDKNGFKTCGVSVSYTHLTLPTKA